MPPLSDAFAYRLTVLLEKNDYLIRGIRRSLQIFRARSSSISVWRGTDECVFSLGCATMSACGLHAAMHIHSFASVGSVTRASYQRDFLVSLPCCCALPAG